MISSTPRDERGHLDYKDTASGRLSYDYYANNLLKDTVSSNADGLNLGYRYDDANRLAFVDDASQIPNSSSPIRTTAYTYNANGSLETVTQPNAVVHSYAYDPLNRLTALSVSTLSSQILRSYTYSLRASGHRQQVVEGNGRTTNYAYDEVYRLTSEAISGDPAGENGTVGYTLDKVGNRSARSSSVPSVSSAVNSFNSRDQLNSDTYDTNGNTTISSGVTNQDVYDFEDRLIVRQKPDGSTVNLAYDADGIRIQKTLLAPDSSLVATHTYLVEANNLTGYAQVVEEYQNTTAGTTSLVYVYGSDLISVVRVDPNAQSSTRYFAYDGLGNVRALTNESGVVTDTWDYDAYGNLLSRTGTTDNALLYRGERFDADLGLYYLRARYLNPDSGRFWSQDSYEGSGSDPMSLHKYLYAHANPVMFSDPSGHESLVSTMITGAVIGILAKTVVVAYKTNFFSQSYEGNLLREYIEAAGYGALGGAIAGKLLPHFLVWGRSLGPILGFGRFGAGTAIGGISGALYVQPRC